MERLEGSRSGSYRLRLYSRLAALLRNKKKNKTAVRLSRRLLVRSVGTIWGLAQESGLFGCSARLLSNRVATGRWEADSRLFILKYFWRRREDYSLESVSAIPAQTRCDFKNRQCMERRWIQAVPASLDCHPDLGRPPWRANSS